MFQGGPSVELLTAVGKEPAKRHGATVRGGVRREFDKSVRSFVFVIDGGPSTRLELGAAKPLALRQPCRFALYRYALFAFC